MGSRRTQKAEALLMYDFEQLHDNPTVPPSGYRFVPKGDVYITRHCRDLTSSAGQTVYVVYDKRTIKRVGLHCPCEIFETVAQNAAASADKRAKAVVAKDSRDDKRNRLILNEMFPRMPSRSVKEVLDHGFQKGSRRVGRSMKLEEEERTELAVHAHARHNFTDYDSYLTEQRKVGNRSSSLRSEARERVHKQVKSIVNSWRPEKIDTVATRLSNRDPKQATALAVETRKGVQQKRKDKHVRPKIAVLATGSYQHGLDGKCLSIPSARDGKARGLRKQRKSARRRVWKKAACVKVA
ncbi:hypothetical protein N7G274_008327 [Stereocaulon virgatum]|uniref:DUF2293 domain-containing protein n=1 Tax=Stereocaulon virgatum TaxID=373712 RepID=A0ABR4A3M5_9LECA